jgi:hypothetical protein
VDSGMMRAKGGKRMVGVSIFESEVRRRFLTQERVISVREPGATPIDIRAYAQKLFQPNAPSNNTLRNNQVMKQCRWAMMVLLLGSAQTLSTKADELYRLSWRGTVYQTNGNGEIVTRTITEKDFVDRVANNNGLDPRGLVFVYRALKHDTAVVTLSTGAFVADVIQMEYNFFEIKNSGETKIIRQAFLYDEDHEEALGSCFGTETARRDGKRNLSGYSFRGTFQYALPESGTIISGSFATGKRVNDSSGN